LRDVWAFQEKIWFPDCSIGSISFLADTWLCNSMFILAKYLTGIFTVINYPQAN